MIRKLNICGVDFKIEYHKKIVEDNELCLGVCKSDENLIKLKTRMNKDKKKEVLMHEAIHGMSEILGIGLNEQKVNTLGVVIIDFIKRNKKFIKQIMEEK